MASYLLSRIQTLGDLELAVLVSMVADEHCVFSTSPESVKGLQEELRLTCTDTYGIRPALVECCPKTTVDEFNEALLIEADNEYDETKNYVSTRPSLGVKFNATREPSPGRMNSVPNLDDRRIADVVIATALDTASEAVQVQAFELLRSRRIFTRSAMHTAPKGLLFITILSQPKARLTRHLNDLFAMSHFHAEDDGLPHLEGEVDKSSPGFIHEDIRDLQTMAKDVNMTHEIAQYLHNIVVFMRNSRYVKGGVTATATRQLRILSMALAPLHGLDYVPPSLVALAARKIYAHRLVLATAENERSLLWGSDPRAVKELLEGLTVEDVIDDVLNSIETPL